MNPDLQAALAIAAGFLVLLALAGIARRRFGVSAESSRKIVHVGGGLLSLGMPWLFTDSAVVLALGVACAAALWVGKRWRLLPSVHGVARRTSGSEFYPLSVALLFVVSEGQAWLFVPSLLVLAVADAFAALIGVRFGRHRYVVEEESKSVEGSLAFLAIALPAILLPLLALTELSWPAAALSALLVALLVTGFEAVSLRGTDNLFVPIGVCVILAKITAQPVAEIVYQNVSLIAILLAGGWLARRTRSFNVGGALVALLFCYGAWSLASERWAAAALIGFVAYAGARRWIPARAEYEYPVRVRIAFRTVAVPLLALVCANTYRLVPEMAGVYAAAVSAAVAQSLWNHWMQTGPVGTARPAGFWAVSGLALALIAWLPNTAAGAGWWTWAAILPAPLLVLAANILLVRYRHQPPEVWGAFQLSLTLLVTAAYLL